ncbi:MAG: hypothetical protein GY910_05715 [bacterium]|nr:hypothetical protein [bacterium]
MDVKLQLDFSEVTVGGGIEVTYDATRLEFASFAFAPDPTMLLQTGPGDAETAQPLEVGSGWLILVPPYGVSGHLDVGTFTFRPLAEGFAFVATGPSAMVPGPFYSPTPSDDALTVSFDAATVEVIPEPGFAISITLGGMMLFGFTWAKRTRPHRHQ